MNSMNLLGISDFDIAIIGMSGRFPQANSVDEFWDNLLQGKDCISRENPLLTRENGYEIVHAFGAITNPFHFDNEFFDISAQEAESMEPQERILLQCAYEALEDAGCSFDKYPGKIGIVCGAQENEYYLEDRFSNKSNNPVLIETEKITNAGTSLCSRISYKLNLTGPSLIVSTACATSLSAVHIAARMLLNYEADLMLAGGANVSLNQNHYIPIEGMISREGVVRAFDKNGTGLVPGNGVGIILLKRFKEAVLEGDNIYAVIKGSAIGNDGNRKIGFAAPSLQGEYEVIREALDFAQLKEKEIDYIETHGTGTQLGDAIEIRTLNRIFAGKVPQGSIGIGSLKSNCGHMNFAAGIAGIIKAALILKNEIIPPSLHHTEDNEELTKDSPLYVVKDQVKLGRFQRKRHVGVSAFGVGGANAHLILEEYREEDVVENPEEREQLLVFSGKSNQALTEIMRKNEDYLKNHLNNLENIAYTLLTGRKHYNYRSYLVMNRHEVVKRGKPYHLQESEEKKKPQIIFLFPGTGSAYDHMGQDLYKKCEIFRRYFQQSNEILNRIMGMEVDLLETTDKTLMAVKILICSYSLGKTLMEAGILPDKVIGHSLGEYALAALSEIITLADAIKLVYERAKLIATLPTGRLVSVVSDSQRIEEVLSDGVYLAAINAPNNLLLSCLEEHFEGLKSSLNEKGYRYVALNSDMPAHSPTMEMIAKEYETILSGISFREGKLNLVSSYLGRTVRKDELSNPEYWIAQMINPVNFSSAIEDSLEANDERKIFIEIGPGCQLTSLVKRNLKDHQEASLFDIMGWGKEGPKEWSGLLKVMGDLWKIGMEVDLGRFYSDQIKKVSLPTYSFQMREYNALRNTSKKELKPIEPEKETKALTYEFQWVENNLYKGALKEKSVLVLEKGSCITEAVQKKRAAFEDIITVDDYATLDQERTEGEFSSLGSKLKILFEYQNNKAELISLLEALNLLHKDLAVYVLTSSLAENTPDYSLSVPYGICEYYNSLAKHVKLFSINMDSDQNPYIMDELLYNRDNQFVIYRMGKRFVRSKQRNLKPIADRCRTAFFNFEAKTGSRVREYLKENFALDIFESYQESPSSLVIKQEDFSYFKALEMEQDKWDNIQRIQDYPGLYETYNRLCLSGAANYFRNKNIAFQAPYKIPDFIAGLGVIEEFRDFVFYLLEILVKGGYAKLEKESVVFLNNFEDIKDLEIECQKACQEQPQFAAYVQLFLRCAENYEQVFSGEVEGNSILYPDGKYDLINSVDQQIPNLERTWTYIRILPSLVKHMFGKTKKPLKLLEIGGGTGIITWPLLEALQGERVEYYFTDIGKSFISDAEREAQKRCYQNVKFGIFNLEKDYPEENFYKQQFDLIIGFDVLQATSNIKKVMDNLYQLLKDNGLMIMLQSFWLHDIVSMIYGFAPGWWNFQKDERRKGKTLASSAQEWEYFYKISGLKNIYTISGGYDGSRNDAGIIIGNKLSSAQEKITLENLGDYLSAYAQAIISVRLQDLLEEGSLKSVYEKLEQLNEQYEEGKDFTVLLKEPETREDYELYGELLIFLSSLAKKSCCHWQIALYNEDNLQEILRECNQRYQSPLTITFAEKNLQQSSLRESDGPLLSRAEAEIIALIQEIVGEKNIQVADDLYDIGIDSLSILIIKAKLQNSFQCDLSVKEIYECRTIKKFASLIEERKGELSPDKKLANAQKRNKSLANLFEKIKVDSRKDMSI